MDENRQTPTGSFDALVERTLTKMEKYKGCLENLEGNREFMASDKKKMLALPFLLSKRVELPEPKEGQKEWELFRQMFGVSYDKYSHVNFDPEEKITEYNYEHFIDPEYLKDMDT